MQEVGDVGRYAFRIGQDAAILAQFGATDAQVKAYIANRAASLPLEKMAVYHVNVDIGSRNYREMLCSQAEANHVNNLRLMVIQQWDCLS